MKVSAKDILTAPARASLPAAVTLSGMLFGAMAAAQEQAPAIPAPGNIEAAQDASAPPGPTEAEAQAAAEDAATAVDGSVAQPEMPEADAMAADVTDEVEADLAAESTLELSVPAAGAAAANPDEDAGPAGPGAQDAQSATPAAEAEYVPQSDPVRDYLDAIERTEALSSAYSSELADLYLGLGQHHLERQEFEEARKAFLRGMQVTRVNNGLYAPEQTHFMFSIADIESRLGELSAAEEILRNIYAINARSLGHHHPDMLPVLSQMLNWYTARNVLYGPGSRYSNMVKAERITNEMAMIIERANGLAHPETASIYRRLGQLNFHLADQLTRFGYADEPMLSFSSGSDMRAPGIPPSVKTHFNQGRDAFSKYADSVYQDASRSALERADAIAQLADWYLVFEKSQTAGDTYARAYLVLQEATPDPGQPGEYFGTPKPLDFMDVPQYNPRVQEDLAGELLEVSMTVTKAGRVRNLEILQIPGDLDKDQLRRVRKELNSLRFRPRVVDGLTESTDRFVWQYPSGLAGAAP